MGVSLGALFDGQLHFMDPEEDWDVPYIEVLEWVEMETLRKDHDPLESHDWNFTSREHEWLEGKWATEEGWATFNVMLQGIATALGGELKAIQLNHRTATGELVEAEYQLQYIPGPLGWQGGEEL